MSDHAAFPVTIDDAEAQGWTWLGARCATCRYHTLLPFKLLRTRTRERELAAIRLRLYCQRCGFPPDQVALTRMVTPPGQHRPTHEGWPFPDKL